ncbi:MAG: hypothetical protein IID60_09690 [Proteobacteria bacterium]|nr:hypothetical protein [Pseudomonadota bacterium]
MQHERDPLNLGSLPLVSPPGDDWPIIEAALRKQNSRRRIVALTGSTLAIAAAVILVVGVFVYRPYGIPAGTSGSQQQQTTQVESPVASDGPKTSTLDSLIALSQQLESNLRKIRSRVGVMPTSSVIYQIELEDLVAQVDEELSMRPDSMNLWSQRINLMLDLTQLYQNELRREYHAMASL